MNKSHTQGTDLDGLLGEMMEKNIGPDDHNVPSFSGKIHTPGTPTAAPQASNPADNENVAGEIINLDSIKPTLTGILKKFSEFLALHENGDYMEPVDIACLVQECNTITPTQLKLSITSDNRDDSDLAKVIIQNLLKYAPNQRFPLFGLRAIWNIVSKSVTIEEIKMQQILLLHLTKVIMNPVTVAKIIELRISRITAAEIQMDDRIKECASVAYNTVRNSNVRSIIDDSIAEIFGSHVALKISQTKDTEIDVVFVDCSLRELRGYSGYNIVYINKDHFLDKLFKNPRYNELVLIDVATLAIHELAHVRVRTVFDDLNFSAPIMVAPQKADDNDLEFGRIVEQKIFGLPVDWLDSLEEIPSSFVEDFLKSIAANDKLPVMPAALKLYPRSNPLSFYGGVGMDMGMEGVLQ